jgi:hypothetical protein
MGEVRPIDETRVQTATIRLAVGLVRLHSEPVVHDLLDGIEQTMLSALNVSTKISDMSTRIARLEGMIGGMIDG